MRKLYASAGQYIPRDHPKFEVALEAERDMQLLGYVFDQLNTLSPGKELLTRIRKAVKDFALPQQDRGNSAGRDAAFELFVCALCKSQSLTPVEWEEPDITCVLDRTKFGIAAKRVKSAKRVIE
jgi:hypothetical protein